MTKKPKDIVISVRKNKRCRGGFQILDIDKFNRNFLFNSIDGTRALFTDEDGEVLRIFVKTTDCSKKIGRRSIICRCCVLGNKIAKRNHCHYLRCCAGSWVVDVNDMLEDI